MVSGINTYNYNGDVYRQKSQREATIGFILATAASATIESLLPSFSNPFLKQMHKEHANNYLYKDRFINAVEKSNLPSKGLKIMHTDFQSIREKALYEARNKIIDGDVKAGLNAYYNPGEKIIKLNLNKASISGFHELGHAANHLNGKLGKLLQKCRVPGYYIAGLMGTLALVSRNKPKDAKKDFKDFVLDNCASIAFVSMLPTVAEEALASHKGIKFAKQAGMSEKLLKNLKKFYGKALLSYLGHAFVAGLSVYAVSKITEIFTRPEKIERKHSIYTI